MNINTKKLTKISAIFRILVLVATAIMMGYLVYAYAVHGEIRFSSDMLFMHLWQDSAVSKILLLGFKLPSFLLLLLGVYWLQRLLGYYQQGLFFGDKAMQCYLWLVWLKVVHFVVAIVETLGVGYYHRSLYGATRIEVNLDFSNITTLLLMLVIVYLLKAAKEIDAENKEFI